ncbi:TetR/AcrR family transcriptional regulator [Rubrobacter taiwanensis]|uniref:TetR/AcrR family transcriptional regulator n=1 Tax=Rubrobacter taiwanensis TaxID=185139 RepID=A0A4R1BL30_9ACTN|nr:TetR/AcrR family transcriptional regulator [Rubrobacter taiwanensis]TCJ18121.1 TetR/AcrR family transcriptional regulator [Rubrobacter taiwanensis]
MARKKEFDPDGALARAIEVFWQRGYEAASVQELLDAMGIGRGSLYDTFGDKRTLFLAALERFEAERVAWMEGILDQEGSALDNLEEFFARTVKNLTRFEPRRGCMIANSAVELAPHDPEVARRAGRFMERNRQAFERVLIRARRAGEIPPDADPEALSRFLVNALQGLRVLARAGWERSELADAARTTLAALRPPGRPE